ncbi:hypothetical protein IT575_06445 [bacterium]|nr:hypothetical protein [bacterium]
MRIFNYNWRLAWAVIPAFLWAWLGLTVVTGAMLRPDGPGGPPPLGLKLERGLHGLHIPGILRGVREEEDALILVMELPHGAREILEGRAAEGVRGENSGGKEPGLLPGLDKLLGGSGELPPGQAAVVGTDEQGMPIVIPELPKLPEGVRIEIVEPGELSQGRPFLELVEGSRVIDLPRGDKLILGQRWAVRVGSEGARLLKRPAGNSEKLRRWIRRMRDGEGEGRPGDGPRERRPGMDERQHREERREDRRHERREDRRGGDRRGGDRREGGGPQGPPAEHQDPGGRPPQDRPPAERPPQGDPPQGDPPQGPPPGNGEPGRPPQRPPQKPPQKPPQNPPGRPPGNPPQGQPGGGGR